MIELAVVIALLAVFFALAGNRVFRGESRTDASFRFLAVLNRRLALSSKHRAELRRLTFQINADGPEEVWVEKISSNKLEKSADSKEQDKPLFVKDLSFLKEPKKLSSVLSLSSAEFPHQKEAQTEGRVFVYYHPKGPGPEAAFHFKSLSGRSEWTLYFPPIQRELRLVKGHVSLKDLQEGF